MDDRFKETEDENRDDVREKLRLPAQDVTILLYNSHRDVKLGKKKKKQQKMDEIIEKMHREPFGDAHTKYMILVSPFWMYNIRNQGRGIFCPFQPSAVTISNRRAADSGWLTSDAESTEMTQGSF